MCKVHGCRTICGQKVKARALGPADGLIPARWKITAPGFQTIVKCHFKWQAFNIAEQMVKSR